MLSVPFLLRACRAPASLVQAVVFVVALLLPASRGGAFDLFDAVLTLPGLTNQQVRLGGRAELRLTGAMDPLPGSVVDLQSPDAWLLLPNTPPSVVLSTLLPRVRISGDRAVPDLNCRVAAYAQGGVVVPHGPAFTPLELFSRRELTGVSRRLNAYGAYNIKSLGFSTGAIGSFRLRRGYLATLAQQENGSGVSRNYVAQDGDLEVSLLPSALENNVRFIRVFPWRWTGKKGIAGDIESGLNVQWGYNWNLSRDSTPDWEYVPIRQVRYWPDLDQDWRARGSTHLLGYNEPDRPDQANITVGDAIYSWPDLLATGLRVGAPAVSDGGVPWLSQFIAQADAAGLRVDFVPVHYYACHGKASDPAGAASRFHSFLQNVHDIVKRPLWVTEWNNGANWTTCADPTATQQAAAVQAMIEMLEDTPFVERYALFNWVEDVRRLKWDDGSLTAAGVRYRDKVTSLGYRQEMPDAGAGSTARYPFDGDARDASGSGADAMCVGAPRFVAGRHGGAISLNGSSDYVQISPRVGDSSEWSFAGWVFWNGGGDWQRIFDLGADTSHYLFLTPRAAGAGLRFAINTGSGEQQLNAPALATGVWTHLAVTLKNGVGKLFVNGTALVTNAALSHRPVNVGTRFNYLGRSQFPSDPLFFGRFDDFRFQPSALTDAQVRIMAEVPPPGFRQALLRKPAALVGQPYTGSLVGDATGSGPLTYARVDGPPWLTVAASGTLGGTPTAAQGGRNRFRVQVTDTNGAVATAALELDVPGVTASVRSSADDAEQSLATGAVSLDSTDLELVNDRAGGADDQLVGLRFADVPVPPGAILTNAFLQFTADETQNEPTVLTLTAEKADDARIFLARNNDLGSRPRTALHVSWQPAAWTAGAGVYSQQSPNLAGVLQEVFSRPGWRAGNALVVLIGGHGHRTADAFDKSGGAVARLIIEYRPPPPEQSVTRSISAPSGDAEEALATGAVSLSSTDLELVQDPASSVGDQIVGLRFPSVGIPASARISRAEVQLSANEAQSDPTQLILQAEDSDAAAEFGGVTRNLSARPRTAAHLTWTLAPWSWAREWGPAQRTPDLAPLLRELVQRPGWSVDSPLVLLISGSGHRTADAYEDPGGTPAVLKVEFTDGVPFGTFEAWARARPGAEDPAADGDMDGRNNWQEYAMGSDPFEVDPAFLQPVVREGGIEFEYSRAVEAVQAVWLVDWTSQLGSGEWSEVGVTQEIVADNGRIRRIRVRVFVPGATTGFVRLRWLP